MVEVYKGVSEKAPGEAKEPAVTYEIVYLNLGLVRTFPDVLEKMDAKDFLYKIICPTMALPMKRAVAMKAMTAEKAIKTMKTKRVSKIAKSKFAKAMVQGGFKPKTSGGLAKDELFKNKRDE
eukprot:16428682-Heterocapsa_arctica.AAC.1